MTDSLIVARALLRLGPFARSAHPEVRSRRKRDILEPRQQRTAHRSDVRSNDPWGVGAARAAFTIWAAETVSRTDAPAGRPRR